MQIQSGDVDAQLPSSSYFSYSSPTDPRLKRYLVQGIEKFTGQPFLRRLYLHNQQNPKPGESFWDAAIRKLKLDVDCDFKGDVIPATGPLVVVSNHPYGVLDGIILSWLVSKTRNDFRIVANSVLYRAPELRQNMYPIDFDATQTALETNIDTRRKCDNWLRDGGAILIFPGGGVATASSLFGPAEDLPWGTYTSRLIMRHQAAVVPVYFSGQNSRLFQIASQISQTLREALLFWEIRRRIDTTVPLRVGQPLSYGDIAHFKKRQDLIDHLREITFALGANIGRNDKRM